MTTELLQKVIATVEILPIEEQNTILQRWLYELETYKLSQSSQSQVKLSELLLLPELEETETLFERDEDTGRDITL
ncbi:hypothetical protein MEN41_22245 [Dolichospermum sp. ST_con]|jgi:hypothetical protein|nr:hypothetical protein [Dolichospermum sp. ST_con]MDD1422389.1 hypothetical protein [Dolichospermum sp. ST_sed1]MDD1427701.1 hypothetical protein [Dolichospermum sp. ST_sed9]MDD1434350.1 hypothetical protein [Dolichospermum sp. ST_sed6]MDD1443692.1 hypothetical protein [Dolichospermum sp. ST_sed3]MDD1444841.1 hypothetical protein [Dolichospermum sp. ST_sed8]MDD1453410.1 hypothetical protein [Dolichospermum sp. ST_sed7]MDD1458900.1 hypothetical protein [Dolichospermum sp. ST_sed2]MDD1469751